MHTHNELVSAVRSGDAAAISAAIGGGASIDERDARGHTALMLACASGDVTAAGTLLEAGASPNRRTLDREETVLHQLARQPQSKELLALILAKRCRIDRRDRFGWTPLMVAAHSGSSEVAHALIDAGADPSVVAPDGRTVQELAAAGGHESIVALADRHGT